MGRALIDNPRRTSKRRRPSVRRPGCLRQDKILILGCLANAFDSVTEGADTGGRAPAARASPTLWIVADEPARNVFAAVAQTWPETQDRQQPHAGKIAAMTAT